MARLSSWVKGFITFTYMPTHQVHSCALSEQCKDGSNCQNIENVRRRATIFLGLLGSGHSRMFMFICKKNNNKKTTNTQQSSTFIFFVHNLQKKNLCKCNYKLILNDSYVQLQHWFSYLGLLLLQKQLTGMLAILWLDYCDCLLLFWDMWTL